MSAPDIRYTYSEGRYTVHVLTPGKVRRDRQHLRKGTSRTSGPKTRANVKYGLSCYKGCKGIK